ncbi:MAG: PIN domain-containing protein [Bryobacteraceae bacterium]|nr:PIN domain-containing protein [Bryobacteraceae bacterium]
MWIASENRRLNGTIAAHAYTTIAYTYQKHSGSASARKTVAELLSIFDVARVDRAVLQRALDLGWPDFEDAVTAACAEAAQCDLIVTCDPRGFPRSPVPARTPEATLRNFR